MKKNSLVLREERAFKIKTAEQIALKAEAEGRSLSDEEITETDDLISSTETLLSDIENLEYNEKQVTKIHDLSKSLKNTTSRSTTSETSDLGSNVPESRIPAQYNKMYSRLTAFENTDDGRYSAFESGMWLRAKFFKDDRAHRWCELNGVYHRLAQEEGGSAGNLVPSPLLARIIDLRDKYGVFRQECDLIPMGRDTLSIPKLVSGTAAAFFGESATISESDPVWTQVNLTAQKLGIITRLTTEVAEDAVINLADWIARDMGLAFANKEDEVGFAGDGSAADGSITGVAQIFTDDNTLAGAVDPAAGVVAFTDVDAASIGLLMATLPAYARPNAKWYASSVGQDLVFNRLASAAGGHTFQTLRGELGASYLGHQIVTSEHLPNSTGDTDNTTLFLFGDLRMAAVMGDRRGVTVASSEERYFELDQIALRATERFDIAIHGQGDASTAGAIVALIGRA